MNSEHTLTQHLHDIAARAVPRERIQPEQVRALLAALSTPTVRVRALQPWRVVTALALATAIALVAGLAT